MIKAILEKIVDPKFSALAPFLVWLAKRTEKLPRILLKSSMSDYFNEVGREILKLERKGIYSQREQNRLGMGSDLAECLDDLNNTMEVLELAEDDAEWEVEASGFIGRMYRIHLPAIKRDIAGPLRTNLKRTLTKRSEAF